MLHSDLLYDYSSFHHWYQYILDIINSKFYKPVQREEKVFQKNVCVIFYENKGLDDIDLSRLLKSPDVIVELPHALRTEENQPRITYKLGPSIRNKIFNYKETVESIYFDNTNEVSICECHNSPFRDADHNHVLTGDLRIIEHAKLRRLLTKGPNFREPRTVNYTRCIKTIDTSLDTFINNMCSKFNLDSSEFRSWKEKVLSTLNQKVETLKRYKTPKKTNPVLKNNDALQYLEQLHNRYVVVPIDKASNNVAFICKSFYIKRLLSEVGITGSPSDTYSVSNRNPHEIIDNNIMICDRFGLKVDDAHKKLPIMYWIPKCHKKPIGARFIIASSSCSTKPLSKAVSSAFKLIFDQINNFHLKSKFYSHLNMFWVIQNSFPVKEKLEIINTRKRAKCISTYDFSTLYTKITHSDLLKELNKVIDFAFEGGSSKYIAIESSKAFWCRAKHGKTCFTKTSLKTAIKHLICESYFQVGNKLLLQTIGIPMGIDPAPFWANLYLHRHEYNFMLTQKSHDIVRARKFHGCARFIDDMCCLNDGGEFGKSYKDIYPKELELKCEHQGTHATFLDLEIVVEDGLFVYKLFDKRDDFPFHIVRMPNRESNIPSYIFYGTILSEYLRIARSTLQLNDFLPRIVNLVNRMINQGGQQDKIFRQFNKAMDRHPDTFHKYNKTSFELINHIKSELSLRRGST